MQTILNIPYFGELSALCVQIVGYVFSTIITSRSEWL
jgi:hypothetical protein